MPNGDCPVGSANAANIRTLEREMGETRDEVRQLGKCVQDLEVRRARLDGWSALLIAVITAVASIFGPPVAAAVKSLIGQ